MESPAVDAPFEEMVAAVRGRLERAFVARYGIDVAPDLTADVIAWAWEHRSDVAAMANPGGYLFRVGQSRARRYLRWRRGRAVFPPESASEGDATGLFEPGLDDALAALDPDQRTAVMLVHCFGWTQPEVAEFLDIELHTVRNRVHRGLARLRRLLGVNHGSH